jgi:hypothetical protein
MWQTYSTLLGQHHGVVNSEILGLAFIAFWNQTLQIHPSLPGVLRRFETALLYPRPNRRDIISEGLLPSHALPPAKYY